MNGTAAIPNGLNGVGVGDPAVPADGAGTIGNFIGGTLTGAGNVISGNLDDGIEISGSTTSNNYIQGNLIGTNVSGSAALPNQRMGVRVDDADTTHIGDITS